MAGASFAKPSRSLPPSLTQSGNRKQRVSVSGEHRLPACSCRQLAGNIFAPRGRCLKPAVLASCEDEQAGSRCSPKHSLRCVSHCDCVQAAREEISRSSAGRVRCRHRCGGHAKMANASDVHLPCPIPHRRLQSLLCRRNLLQ